MSLNLTGDVSKKKKDLMLKEARKNKMSYSYYAYMMYVGCYLAKKLKIPKVSVIEFGVAGGNGLVAMEKHAHRIEEELGVEVDIYGFDTGEGMPPAKDQKDMPHFFRAGNYCMDEVELRKVLNKAELVIGDATKTFPDFLNSLSTPIAAISYDMDHYYPTLHTLNALVGPGNDEKLIPRIPIYFDNTVGNHIKAYNEFTGELAAINDFNQAHEGCKIALCRDFLRRRKNYEWYHQIYFLHLFEHPLYDQNISSHKPSTLRLKH